MQRSAAVLMAGLVAAATLSTTQPTAVRAATFAVTSTADSGPGTLRQAILDANAAAGSDTIVVDIPGAGPHTIALLSPLPASVGEVTIDASSASIGSAPGLFLDGSAAGEAADGLVLASSSGSDVVSWLGIVGFDGDGIVLDGPSGATISSSYIGTDGATDQGNGGAGIRIVSGEANVIEGNVISGNAGPGIAIDDPSSSSNDIRGNLIGTDATGTAAIGNGAEGIRVTSNANTIGAVESPNVISGNTVGVHYVGPILHDNTLAANRIGTDASGTGAIPNTSHGVLVEGVDGDDLTIGGASPDAGNIIANNGGDGIRVTGAAGPLGVSILNDRIRDNAGLGVDLGGDGVTANDAGDGDSGPNSFLNFPVITATGPSDVSGTLDAAAGSYRIDAYASPACDPSGFGEGATLLDSVTGVSPGPFGIDTFPIDGTFLSAIATNETTGESSEFSSCFQVTGALPAAGDWEGLNESIHPADPEATTPGTFLAAGAGPGGDAQFTYKLPASDGGGVSGVWSFYTTAESAGTIQIPWRYTGHHAYFQVTARLEAVVVRDGDTLVSSVLLVNAGPADCCTPPSGGFDHSGTASFTVQTGDVLGFVLRGSNFDSNDLLQGELTIGTEVPTSCADAQDLYGATEDGTYVIHPVGGQRFRVHCADMDAVGTEYLDVTTGPGLNYGQYAAGGASVGTTVTTSFSKLRLDPATLRVDIGDLTFATSTGSLTHPDTGLGNPTVTSMPYATAMACNNDSGSNGSANVHLGGTPFAVDDTWAALGTSSTLYGGAVFSAGNQVVDIQGNGFCGWRTPYPDGPFFVFDPAAGQFGLQLRYLNEPAVSLATPVLFASIARAAGTADLYTLVDGAENAPLTVEVRTGDSCSNGALVSPTLVDTVEVTSDAEGYVLLEGVEGIASGDFVTVKVTSPAATDSSRCVRTTADNDYWPKALELASGATVATQDVIEVTGKARWYRVPILPDQRVTVTLSGLPADYDLAVFKDISKEFESQIAPQGASDLHQLSAEFAPSVFSPSVFSPSVFSPSVFSPDAYAPSVFSPSVFSPSVFSPSVFSPSVFSPSVFSPSVFSPSVFSPSVFSPSVFSPSVFSPSVFSPSVFSETDLAQAFSSAQTRSLIGVSANPGTGDESVVVNTWNNIGHLYIRVSGRGGAFDPDDLFTVTVQKSGSSCDALTTTQLAPRSAHPDGGDFRTVIVTDSSRLALGSASDPASLGSRLAVFAARAEVDGVVVDVAGDPTVSALKAQVQANLGCPFAVNLLAEEIKGIVDSYRSPDPGVETLRYVTIIGGDTVIPFFRYPDQSRLGQESEYFPPVRNDSISEASLRRDFVLSQDAYGSGVSVDIRTNSFPVPGLAVGRLVESPAEIAGMLDAYTATNGVVSPSSALVTGYDFLTDAADAVSSELAQGMDPQGTGQAVDDLITDSDVSPDRLEQAGDTDPRRFSWTADDLRDELFGSRHDVIFLAGHFSANSALAADYDTQIVTTELAASPVDLVNSIVFSAGCHSGYNLVDGEALSGVSLPLDWAQAFAQKRAVLIAGTGYQYGDTEFLEYSERLYRDFARELRAGPAGTVVSVGEALARAKRTYLATTSEVRNIHEKALLEATLFGLPMFGVDMPAGRGSTLADGGAIDPVEQPPVNGEDLGLAIADLDVGTTTTPRSLALDVIESTGVTGSVTARWLDGPDGVVTNPAEPALPKHVVNVTSVDRNQVLRGVGFRGGVFDDTPDVLPLSGAPTTDLRGVHAPFVSPVFYPMKLWTTNYFGELGGNGGTNLIVTPAQHKSDDAHPGRSIQRSFSDLDLRLFYSSNLTDAALSDAPTIVSVEAARDGADVVFRAQVVGDPKAALREVWITWTDGNGLWASQDLTQCVAPLPTSCGTQADSRIWTGRLSGAPSNIAYVVQAANGVGLVAFDDNLGRYYGIGGLPVTATSLTLVSPPESGTFGDTVSVGARLETASGPLAGKLVTIAIGGSTGFATTDGNGLATVAVPLSSRPDQLGIVASFGGDATHGPSSASSPFTVQQATTALTLSVPPATLIGEQATAVATLTGAGGPLDQRTVAFLVTPPGSSTATVSTAITDHGGRASLALPTSVVGVYTVEVRFGSSVAIAGGETLDLQTASYGPASASASHQVRWPFAGFFAPVDNPTVVNSVNAGSTVPVKFSIGGNRGASILASGYPKAVKYTCASGVEEAVVEETSTANSGLTYDPVTQQYKYNWKTAKTYKGSCYRLTIKLVDGTSHIAEFRFH